MRLSSYANQKKDDDLRHSSPGAFPNQTWHRNRLCAWLINSDKRPTGLAWLLIVAGALFFWYSKQSGSNESDANMVYDDNVNPKFRVIHPQAPNLQLDEFKLQHELNKRKPMQGARESHIVAPHFDPNKHPVPDKVRQEQIREPHKHPKVREYPVMITHKPDVQAICKDRFDFLLIVESVTADLSIRRTIRNTWAKSSQDPSSRWSIIFVCGDVEEDHHMGDEIRASDGEQKDMLRGDFLDTHHENTRKFLMSMDWVMNELVPHCQPNFIMVSRERIYHNVPAILQMLERDYTNPGHPLYMGKLLRRDVPIRDKADLMYVSKEDYNKDIFPNMIQSPTYLFSFTAFRMMHHVRESVTPIAPADSYIGLLAEKAGIKPFNNPQFIMMHLGSKVAPCQYINQFFVYNVGISDIKKVYNMHMEQINECDL